MTVTSPTSLHRHNPSSNSDVLFFQSSNDLHSMASMGLPTPTPYQDDSIKSYIDNESSTAEPETATASEEIASLRLQLDSYSQWIQQYLREQSESSKATLLFDLHGNYNASARPLELTKDLLTDIHIATIARNKLHYIKAASLASRELGRQMREAEAMRPPRPPPGAHESGSRPFWPGSLIDSYCQTLRSCTESISMAIEAQQAASYYIPSSSSTLLDPADHHDPSSSSSSSSSSLAHLASISTALEQRLHHDRYALYQLITNDVQEALEDCHWPPPLTPHPLHPSPTSNDRSYQASTPSPSDAFKLQGEEDHLKVHRVNSLMSSLNNLQMVCEAEQFRSLLAQPPVSGAAEEPKLWSILQVRALSLSLSTQIHCLN